VFANLNEKSLSGMKRMSEKKDSNETEKTKKDVKEIPKDEQVETKHSITVNGKKISYTAYTGRMVIKKEEEEKEPQPKASMFYIAYIKDEEPSLSLNKRPITFSFNGGPGSSSVWLHLGLLGPRRVISEKDEPKILPPPYKLVDNEYTLLDETDLVFIDPVSTGYSRAVPGEKNVQFHDFQKDIESVAEFIRLLTTRLKRWSSPKFLIGESYGTTRSAGLSGFLLDKYGLYLNGIMLISSILNFATARFDIGNDLPYALFLPTYATTAWYHKKNNFETLDSLVSEVSEFSGNEYVLALMKGDQLQGEERKNIVSKLAKYTGLSEEYIEQTNLRINIHKFCKQLLRKEGLTVGRLDSRYKGFDLDSSGEMPEFDPYYPAIQGPYTSTFNDYVRRELNYENDVPYEILGSIYKTWKYEQHQNQYLNVAEILRSAMSKNVHLKVFVANGYFDLATPFYATEYTFKHLGIKQELANNITMKYYEAGHMMYSHLPSLERIKVELTQFIKNSYN
jgi:carboxypeptidase C (cathepsin A)